MNQSSRQENKTWMNLAFVVVLLLIILPVILFILLQIDSANTGGTASAGPAVSDQADSGGTAAPEQRVETRTARKTEAATVRTADAQPDLPPDPPAPERFDGAVGAINPNAVRGKQATPYKPGEVPGDSGVPVQYAGSPDDGFSAPPPPPRDDDPWAGRTPTPIPPANMRGIGGVRAVDPNDPFFQQDIPNPFLDR